jgi:hypothetical protein
MVASAENWVVDLIKKAAPDLPDVVFEPASLLPKLPAFDLPGFEMFDTLTNAFVRLPRPPRSPASGRS